MIKISIIINTNCVRKEQLITCIKSIQNNTYKNFEIIVVQQCVHMMVLPPYVKTYKAPRLGTGVAKNVGIKHAKGAFIAFTDDDCIVSRTWLQNLCFAFEKNPKIVSVFGRILPYHHEKHQQYYCPATVMRQKMKIFYQPTYHGDIGSGNNMAYRTSIFQTLGGFKKWLGPGSVGFNADDAEMAMRLLHNNFSILYDPTSVVYHNRWLDKKSYEKQKFEYLLGEVACYTYYACKGNGVALKIMKGYVYNTRNKIRLFREVMGVLYACMVGAFFALIS